MADGTLDELEEITALELIINENDTSDDTNEDDDNEQELPDTIEGLTALLAKKNETIAKRNKSLKKAKGAQHRTQDENSTLQSQFEALEAKVNGFGKPNVEAENLAKQEQELRDRAEDDPSKITEYMDWKQTQLQNNLSSFLGQKFGEFEQSISALRSDTDPEKLEHRTEIAQLRARPEYAHLDDATALTVVKALKSAKVPGGRGTVTGKRVVTAAKPKQEELTDEVKRAMGFPV